MHYFLQHLVSTEPLRRMPLDVHLTYVFPCEPTTKTHPRRPTLFWTCEHGNAWDMPQCTLLLGQWIWMNLILGEPRKHYAIWRIQAEFEVCPKHRCQTSSGETNRMCTCKNWCHHARVGGMPQYEHVKATSKGALDSLNSSASSISDRGPRARRPNGESIMRFLDIIKKWRSTDIPYFHQWTEPVQMKYVEANMRSRGLRVVLWLGP